MTPQQLRLLRRQILEGHGPQCWAETASVLAASLIPSQQLVLQKLVECQVEYLNRNGSKISQSQSAVDAVLSAGMAGLTCGSEDVRKLAAKSLFQLTSVLDYHRPGCLAWIWETPGLFLLLERALCDPGTLLGAQGDPESTKGSLIVADNSLRILRMSQSPQHIQARYHGAIRGLSRVHRWLFGQHLEPRFGRKLVDFLLDILKTDIQNSRPMPSPTRPELFLNFVDELFYLVGSTDYPQLPLEPLIQLRNLVPRYPEYLSGLLQVALNSQESGNRDVAITLLTRELQQGNHKAVARVLRAAQQENPPVVELFGEV